MAKKSKKIIAAPAGQKRKHIEKHAIKLANLKDLRKATKRTQEELAHALGVGQGTISRLEKRDDMLISTLRHYVESVGGELHLMVTFSNRPPLIIERLGKTPSVQHHDDHDGHDDAPGTKDALNAAKAADADAPPRSSAATHANANPVTSSATSSVTNSAPNPAL